MVKFSQVQHILTDIEGTTSDIAFVKNVLFPYSAREMRNFVSKNRTKPIVRECLQQTESTDENSAIEKLLEWIQNDIKHPALKTLQGLIWREGYEAGAFRAHVYPEVKAAFDRWKAQGFQISVYSSGSIEAQKLFFQYSTAGNLLPYFSHHFDLGVGSKKESSSYQKISEALKTTQILFLSDIEAELDAAAQIDLMTLQIVREGTVASKRHFTAASFDEIELKP